MRSNSKMCSLLARGKQEKLRNYEKRTLHTRKTGRYFLPWNSLQGQLMTLEVQLRRLSLSNNLVTRDDSSTLQGTCNRLPSNHHLGRLTTARFKISKKLNEPRKSLQTDFYVSKTQIENRPSRTSNTFYTKGHHMMIKKCIERNEGRSCGKIFELETHPLLPSLGGFHTWPIEH